ERPAAFASALGLALEGRAPAAAPPTGFAVVETNENGDAQAQLPLPNAPGRWRVRAHVWPREGSAPGAGELVLATRKRLAVELGVPERIAVGDVVEVVAAVANEGPRPEAAKLTF